MGVLIQDGTRPDTGNAGQLSGSEANRNRANRGLLADDIPKSINPVGTSNSNPPVGTGLAKGGKAAAPAAGPDFLQNIFRNTIGNNGASASFVEQEHDWRVKVGVNPGSGTLYRTANPGILQPLVNTDGVIFPFVPNVTVNYAARYGSRSLTHTNYTNYFYEASEVQNIQIVGDFAVQNSSDADYFMAVIYFFRAASKMFYGNSGSYQGSPPPILYLNGYGKHYFPNVPCILTYFNHMLPSDVDYIETGTSVGEGIGQQRNSGRVGNSITTQTKNRVPTNSTITIQLQPVYSRKRQTEFDHDAFSRGGQLDKGFL